MRVIASSGAMRDGVLRQLSRPVIVGGGQIALLESDFGGQGPNRGQLTVLREELFRDLRPLQSNSPSSRSARAKLARALGAG